MSNRYLEAEKIGLSLTDEERYQLAERMLESIHPPGEEHLTEREWKAFWKEEVLRRSALVHAGKSKLHSWESVSDKMTKIIEDARNRQHA